MTRARLLTLTAALLIFGHTVQLHVRTMKFKFLGALVGWRSSLAYLQHQAFEQFKKASILYNL
jgi:hypothetical protein